jgi:hypothetical protein
MDGAQGEFVEIKIFVYKRKTQNFQNCGFSGILINNLEAKKLLGWQIKPTIIIYPSLLLSSGTLYTVFLNQSQPKYCGRPKS